MDKKSLRPLFCKAQDSAKPNCDYSCKKNGLQYSKKRENEKFDNSKKGPITRGGRSNQRYVQSKERINEKDSITEIGSVQKSGSKKQNITHLMHWWDGGSDHYNYPTNCNRYEPRGRRSKAHPIKFKKEHYLQANCQFVVSADCELAAYEKDPDLLIEWDLVEEIRLHASEYPACPICLHPPVAAKITRCGHIFCFACILHYLALTDKKWQKCPICYDAITKLNLKSVVTVVHKAVGSGEEIELELMRRDRDSHVPVKVSSYSPSHSCSPVTLSSAQNNNSCAKFIIASNCEISKYIVMREDGELECQLALEGDQPEACFIHEAIGILNTRKNSLQLKTSVDVKNCNYTGSGLEGQFAEAQAISKQDDLELSLMSGPCDEFDDSKMSLGPDEGLTNLGSRDKNQNIGNQTREGGGKATFFFYQDKNGDHVYLHPVNVHMLIKEYGSLEQCPRNIKGKILEKESGSINEAVRHRLRYLRHLPIACPFEFVEIDMKPPLLSLNTLEQFQDQLHQRVKKRKKRARQEYTIEKRVQKEEDRMMGRSRGADINMTSFQHFPSFNEETSTLCSSADEESLPSSSVSSVTIDCADNSPSFAQMIRCGQKKSSLPSSGTAWSSGARKKEAAKNSNYSDDDDAIEEWERVPDFGTAFSDAFAKALDLAAKKKNDSDVEEISSNQRGKKGKKKKRIVLLSSGGL